MECRFPTAGLPFASCSGNFAIGRVDINQLMSPDTPEQPPWRAIIEDQRGNMARRRSAAMARFSRSVIPRAKGGVSDGAEAGAYASPCASAFSSPCARGRAGVASGATGMSPQLKARRHLCGDCPDVSLRGRSPRGLRRSAAATASAADETLPSTYPSRARAAASPTADSVGASQAPPRPATCAAAAVATAACTPGVGLDPR